MTEILTKNASSSFQLHPEATFVLSKALSVQWWLQHLADAYAENPLHMVTEFLLIVFILYLIFKREKPNQSLKDKLSKQEEDTLIAEWQPEPLSSNNLPLSSSSTHVILANGVGPIVKDEQNKEYIHLSSHNYLGFANDKSIKEICKKIIQTNAVGSCGPRGFYGTVDIHLNLEKKLRDHFGNSSIIYADWIACPVSVITAFVKRGDLLVIDEGCHYLIAQGALLSRCNVIWYQHNNMSQLEATLQTLQMKNEKNKQKLIRKFIVTEGIFHNHGEISNLPEIIRLKEEYKYRLILDDSHALGVLHEKGSAGYWGIDVKKIDMLMCSMDTALGTTGGFCIGAEEITYHQTLSAGGYVFSASAPPFEAQAAIEALSLINNNGKEYIKKLQDNAAYMRQSLKNSDDLWSVCGDNISPLIHLRLNMTDEKVAKKCLESTCIEARDKGVLIYEAHYLLSEYEARNKKPLPLPSIRICVTIEHTKDHLLKASNIIQECLKNNLKKSSGHFVSGNQNTKIVVQEDDEEWIH